MADAVVAVAAAVKRTLMRRSLMAILVAVGVLVEHQVEDDDDHAGVSREPPPPMATVKLLPSSWTPHCGLGRIGRTQALVSLKQLPPLLPGCSGSLHTFACVSLVWMGRRKACHKSGNGKHPYLVSHASSCAG